MACISAKSTLWGTRFYTTHCIWWRTRINLKALDYTLPSRMIEEDNITWLAYLLLEGESGGINCDTRTPFEFVEEFFLFDHDIVEIEGENQHK